MFNGKAVLSVAICLWSATGSVTEPLEIGPYRETLVVEARFGEEEGMFAPRSESWGKGEVGGFGPFAVGGDGTIYISDTKANDVKIFAPDGTFVQSVDMRHKHNLVHDLAVCDGRIFWMGETIWGIRLIFVLDPATGDTTRTEATLDPDPSSGARSHPVFGACSLFATNESVSLHCSRAGKSYPVYQHGRVVRASEREAGAKRGLGATSAPSLAFTWEKTVTTAGQETHGDIVRLTPDGRPEKILVRSAGSVHGVAPSCFLHGRMEQNRACMVVTNYEGETLARTAVRKRSFDRAIDIPHRWRLADDCSYYELYLTEDSVCVARWSADR